MRTGVCNPRFLRVDSTWSPSRPGSMRSSRTRSNSSALTRKNPSSPVGATTTSYFSRCNPSRRARATFVSSYSVGLKREDLTKMDEGLHVLVLEVDPNLSAVVGAGGNGQEKTVEPFLAFLKIPRRAR